jgi:hypothetical protein
MTLIGQTFLNPGVWFVDVDIKCGVNVIIQAGGGSGSVTTRITPTYYGVAAGVNYNVDLISGLSLSSTTGLLAFNGRNLQNAFDGYLNTSTIFRTDNQGNTIYHYISGHVSGATSITQLKCVRIG